MPSLYVQYIVQFIVLLFYYIIMPMSICYIQKKLPEYTYVHPDSLPTKPQ